MGDDKFKLECTEGPCASKAGPAATTDVLVTVRDPKTKELEPDVVEVSMTSLSNGATATPTKKLEKAGVGEVTASFAAVAEGPYRVAAVRREKVGGLVASAGAVNAQIIKIAKPTKPGDDVQPVTVTLVAPKEPLSQLNVLIDTTPSLRDLRAAKKVGGSVKPSWNFLTSELLASEDAAKDLAKHPPVVLVRGCKEVEIRARTNPPDKPVSWSIKPHAKNKVSGTPTLTHIDGGKSARLGTNATGAFHVVAELGGVKRIWNVVFVSVEVVLGKPTAVVTATSHFADNGPVAGGTAFRSGRFTAKDSAFEVLVEVKLVGGDSSGLLGVDRVQTHLLQNLTEDTLRGLYVPSGTASERPLVELPIPDADAGTKDIWTSTVGMSVTNPKGTPRTHVALDSPAGSFPTHLSLAPKTSKLNRIAGGCKFKLAVISRSSDASDVFVAHAEINWWLDFNGRVVGKSTTDGMYHPDGPTVGADPSFKSISPATGGIDLADAGYEFRPPFFVGGYDFEEKP